MGKSFIDLSIINLKFFYNVNGEDMVFKTIGIKKTCLNWDDLLSSLDELYAKNFEPLDNVLEDRSIKDGKCYERTIDFIKSLIKQTNFKKAIKF